MDNTQKLLTSVTASVLLLGPGATTSNVVAAPATAWTQRATQKDPEVDKAAEAILKMLEGKTELEAMSREEILQKDASLKPDVATKALRQLMKEGKILKTTDGKYYFRSSHGG